jgi:hypothetical protein
VERGSGQAGASTPSEEFEMIATMIFNGVPVNVSVEPQEPCSSASVQGKIKALTQFTAHVAGTATKTDVRNALASIKLTGNDR